MICTLEELRNKDVINVINGENLGRVDDLELDAANAAITALILYGRPRIFGLFGPRENYIIGFRQIQLIGRDVILVRIGESESCGNCTKDASFLRM